MPVAHALRKITFSTDILLVVHTQPAVISSRVLLSLEILPGRAANCPCYWSSEYRAENFAHHSHVLTACGYAHPCTSKSYCWSQMNEVLQSWQKPGKSGQGKSTVLSIHHAEQACQRAFHAGWSWVKYAMLPSSTPLLCNCYHIWCSGSNKARII